MLASARRCAYAQCVTDLRPELVQIVEALVRDSEASGEVSLDALGDAIGTRSVSYVEIDAMISELEVRERRIAAGPEARGERDLLILLPEVRAFTLEHGRRPSLAELSERLNLPAERLKHALLLARIMQR